ncbi:MAG: Stp1/IreP family PP2C-type Ser/Thr phosphatase [Pseudobutyrivibrio sp.]|nr:Stp1/IreP family PP2C-type Ser/Thr phosphatase [Pseudobutyrivibrio sp.]
MLSFALTDVGVKRSMNQDSVYVSDTPVGALQNLYIVADGMGGELAGDYASNRCIEVVTQEISKCPEIQPIKILEQALQRANTVIHGEAISDPTKKGMGTTIVVATVLNSHLYVANVGDSRLYVANKTKLTQITKDHSVVAELVRTGELDEDDAKNDNRKNMITRAIGAEESLVVDYFDVKLRGTEKILLCSDGLTNMVEDKDIFKILKSTDTIENKVTELVELANNNGGKDNVSTIIVEAE